MSPPWSETPPDQTPPWAGRTPPPSRETPTPQTRHPPRSRPPQEADCSIRSMSGRYVSYRNAFLSCVLLTHVYNFQYKVVLLSSLLTYRVNMWPGNWATNKPILPKQCQRVSNNVKPESWIDLNLIVHSLMENRKKHNLIFIYLHISSCFDENDRSDKKLIIIKQCHY